MPVECGDCQRRQNKIVGEKDKSFIDFFGVIAHPTQEIGITLRREFACEKNGLIAACIRRQASSLRACASFIKSSLRCWLRSSLTWPNSTNAAQRSTRASLHCSFIALASLGIPKPKPLPVFGLRAPPLFGVPYAIYVKALGKSA